MKGYKTKSLNEEIRHFKKKTKIVEIPLYRLLI